MTDRLAQIQARADAATEGPWAVDYDSDGYGQSVYVKDGLMWGRAFICMDIKQGAEDGKQDADFIAHARTDVPALLAMVRERDAALERVEALAAAWHTRGEADMAYSNTVQDWTISNVFLTDGAAMVENARHIRAAITATEGA